MWHALSDMSIPGRGHPLSFTRTYNSMAASAASTSGPMGYGWTFDYAMSLSQSGSRVTITQENNSTVSFTQSGSTWAPAAPRYIASLTQNGNGTWTFVRNNRDTFTFNSAGQLISEAAELPRFRGRYSAW
jgi:GH35 family endo-1,4-beta-xylanase